MSAYVGMLVVSVPAIWSLWRVRALRLVSINVAGVFGGVIVFYGFLQILSHMLQSSGPFGMVQFAWEATLGLMVSVAFGVLAGTTWRPSGRPREGPAQHDIINGRFSTTRTASYRISGCSLRAQSTLLTCRNPRAAERLTLASPFG